ncbi:type II toxin-antitoxin system VapB family antitoxin [Streptomyces sp. ISL-66]|uniref:type II toxin-antitoxin system VapB family antitoxin n=1 Tax=Streptomyces sp. ISL-66 TaxID=2819186 RepID=UPI001BE60B54|nr:type II toxin-antitoxin system VapB family antitoxin [Streptomyces sp. ISL-66]MBT2472240.1 type II toxin-antitoxin system VapB family antitoxin [Streptomyces sp. ISL-66]
MSNNLYIAGVDNEALAAAASILGTKSKKDTVNAVLQDYVRRHNRLQALDRLVEMGKRGDFDDLLDKGNYRR